METPTGPFVLSQETLGNASSAASLVRGPNPRHPTGDSHGDKESSAIVIGVVTGLLFLAFAMLIILRQVNRRRIRNLMTTSSPVPPQPPAKGPGPPPLIEYPPDFFVIVVQPSSEEYAVGRKSEALGEQHTLGQAADEEQQEQQPPKELTPQPAGIDC